MSPTQTGISFHGVLLDIFGVGILITGKSGIGKSEAALDLILRGHRLVADDIIELKKSATNMITGNSPSLSKYLMEIRGIGLINIKDLFGVVSVCDRKIIEMVIELVEWDPAEEYERLGIDEETYSILDVLISYLKIPVRPGRNLSTIIEVAARNQLLKREGHSSAIAFSEKLNTKLAQQEKQSREKNTRK